jgi:hypothetical protein
MKPIDNLRARVFAALCDDLIEGKGFQRLDALRRIHSLGGISGSRASTEPASGLRPTGFDPGRNSVSSQEKEAGGQ